MVSMRNKKNYPLIIIKYFLPSGNTVIATGVPASQVGAKILLDHVL